MSNVVRFQKLVAANGSSVTYHREEGGTPCPCLTPEGYRDPKWHKAHPLEPVCNENGKINVSVTNAAVRAFVQPVQSGATRRLTTDFAIQMFGEVQQDDHLGIFPLDFSGTTFDFQNWSQAGEDYVLYNGRRFLVVNANLIPDPNGGEPHHWEVGLRLLKNERPV